MSFHDAFFDSCCAIACDGAAGGRCPGAPRVTWRTGTLPPLGRCGNLGSVTCERTELLPPRADDCGVGFGSGMRPLERAPTILDPASCSGGTAGAPCAARPSAGPAAATLTTCSLLRDCAPPNCRMPRGRDACGLRVCGWRCCSLAVWLTESESELSMPDPARAELCCDPCRVSRARLCCESARDGGAELWPGKSPACRARQAGPPLREPRALSQWRPPTRSSRRQHPTECSSAAVRQFCFRPGRFRRCAQGDRNRTIFGRALVKTRSARIPGCNNV